MHSRRYGTGGMLTLPKLSGGINRSSSSPLALSRLASPGVGMSSGAHFAGEGVEATVSVSSCVSEGRGVVLTAAAGFYMGANNDLFLTCDDFKVAGADQPKNCAQG